MAAKTKPAKASAYEAEVDYRITLARLVKLGGTVPLPPRGEITVKGAALTQIIEEYGADVIVSAERV
jgi:hypothetical protein